MMNVGGTLLYCQSHEHPDKPQILGRLLDNGDLLVLRFHSGTTVLHSDEYNLQCGCGFLYHIEGTTITGTVMVTL